MTTAHIILLIAVPLGLVLARFCFNTARLFQGLEDDKRKEYRLQ